MQGRDSRFDTSLYSFKSASGVATISEIGLGVRASEKAKMAPEGMTIIGSIVDRNSPQPKRGYNETGGWLSLGLQKPIEGEGLAIDRKR
jgi:hypothetical protein